MRGLSFTLPWRGRVAASRRAWGYLLAGAPPLTACSFLQSERNFLRSLPCRPLASASFEHSSEAAGRGFSAFFSVAAGAAAGAVEVCAKAAPANRSEAASARPAAREDIVIMEAPRKIGK